MSFEFVRKLPTPEEIRRDYPVPEPIVRLKEERDREIRDVFTGKSNKFLVIIGPCSADNEDAVCDYVSRLARVNEKVKDRLILIPRVYTNKPRTTGDGYKGLVHQPDPEKAPDFPGQPSPFFWTADGEGGAFAAVENTFPHWESLRWVYPGRLC